jgi:hypothetical protein
MHVMRAQRLLLQSYEDPAEPQELIGKTSRSLQGSLFSDVILRSVQLNVEGPSHHCNICYLCMTVELSANHISLRKGPHTHRLPVTLMKLAGGLTSG